MNNSSMFVGTSLFRIENYVHGKLKETKEKGSRLPVLRISNIKNTNNEFSVKSLMTQMKALYWNILLKCPLLHRFKIFRDLSC